jgi:hypothetical protein
LREDAMRLIIIVTILSFFSSAVWAGDLAYEDTMKGKKCTVSKYNQSLGCQYIVGKDLEFAIDGIGSSGTMITIFRSNWDGDYYANFLLKYDCVTVKYGKKNLDLFSLGDAAFVSSKNGKVYKTLKECNEGY